MNTCDHCENEFASGTQLRLHMKKHGELSGKEEFVEKIKKAAKKLKK